MRRERGGAGMGHLIATAISLITMDANGSQAFPNVSVNSISQIFKLPASVSGYMSIGFERFPKVILFKK